jgi:segregation and condensation protein B
MSSRVELEAALEAILFVSTEPVSVERLLATFDESERAEAAVALEILKERYRPADERGVMIEEVAGGLRIVTAPTLHPHLRRFFESSGANRLSMAALETLAIVAYRQPMTGPEIQELRGKNPTAALKTLLERRMLRIAGRKEVVGRPFLYATTREFLMQFGLRGLGELPPLEEFEEALGLHEGSDGEPAISAEHEAVGLVSTLEAESTLGSSTFGVHASTIDAVIVADQHELPDAESPGGSEERDLSTDEAAPEVGVAAGSAAESDREPES